MSGKHAGPFVSPELILQSLWLEVGGDPAALASVRLSGTEPALPSSFRVGALAQVSIAAAGLAAAEIWRARTGRAQAVAVDMRHAAIEFRSERYMRLDGKPPASAWDKIAGLYRTGDGRLVRLHTNFPHHRDGILKMLACAYDREAVQAALMKRQGEAFETAAADAGLAVAMMRSPAEWAAHLQGQAVAALPLIEIEKIGEASARPFAHNPQRPLSGIRVLDLTRVIAGPVCGRTLAAHGADVMRVTGPHLPGFPLLDLDTGRGKLSAALDLRSFEERDRLAALLREAHVFVQGYRPGGLANLGFSPEACAELRPGIVVVTLSAYGRAGPWAGRHGFDSLVQTASGINHAEAEAAGAEGAKELPAQALDHATGYLMALAAMMALLRKSREGGSWHVRVSLAQTGHWLKGLGRLEHGFAASEPEGEEITALSEEMETPTGRLSFIRHAAHLSETPPFWARPSVPLGTHAPLWPPDDDSD
ncbi:MAG TPA: CoA transferase [Hyphomicrobiaceae bacterium]|nr:CoA transferase [Hyphomicrobiaceae bacterium]